MYHRHASIGYAARAISTCRNSIDALSWVSNRMLGTPSLTAKAMLIGERVQNFRCRQPEGSGSSGKLCPKSITVTTGPPSGFSTSPRPPKKCQPIRPTTVTIAMPPNTMYRARQGILKPARVWPRPEPLTEGIVIVLAEQCRLAAYYSALTPPSFKTEVG